MSLLDSINELAFIRDMSAYVKHVVKYDDDFYAPLHKNIYKHAEEYEKEHPFVPVFKNGVCVNDESAEIAYSIIHAVNDIDLKKCFPEIPEIYYPTVRYTIAEQTAEFYWMYAWNRNTTDYRSIYYEIDSKKNEVFGGSTVFL